MKDSKFTFLGISLIIAALCLGGFLYKGIKSFTDKDRIVTVKGLAEMDMKAIHSNILISITLSSNNLKEVIGLLDTEVAKVKEIVATQSIKEEDMSTSNIDINDFGKNYDYTWIDGKRTKIEVDRYTVTKKITIDHHEVTTAEEFASSLQLLLIHNNITSRYDIRTDYEFPELNTIKPELIAQSTKNARVAGEQFANDSDANLGKIKTASQGQITIAGRYYYDDYERSSTPEEPYLQRARVVSTIVFFLE